MNWAVILWLALMVLCLLVEAMTVNVVSLWFAGGALVAAVTAGLSGAIWLQVLLFVLVSTVLLASLRPLVRHCITPKITKTNLDSVIGSQGLVTVTIDNLATQGRVKLGAMEWTARSTSGEEIEAGTIIQVDRIEGVKVYVTPDKFWA